MGDIFDMLLADPEMLARLQAGGGTLTAQAQPAASAPVNPAAAPPPPVPTGAAPPGPAPAGPPAPAPAPQAPIAAEGSGTAAGPSGGNPFALSPDMIKALMAAMGQGQGASRQPTIGAPGAFQARPIQIRPPLGGMMPGAPVAPGRRPIA